MNQMLELPEPVFRALMEEIQRTGTTPADWIADRLPPRQTTPTLEEIAAANARLFACVSSGPCGSLHNEAIDADLAREYDDRHDSSEAPCGPNR